MTEGDRAAIDALAASLASFEVEVATKLMPREEIDRRERDVWHGITDSRRLSWQIGLSLGFLNLGLFGAVLAAVLAR